MKLFLVYAIFTLSTASNLGSNWDKIKEKTFVYMGFSRYVFYETNKGLKRCLLQYIGSGCPVVSEKLYSVEIERKEIILVPLKDGEAKQVLIYAHKILSLKAHGSLSLESEKAEPSVVGFSYTNEDGSFKKRNMDSLRNE